MRWVKLIFTLCHAAAAAAGLLLFLQPFSTEAQKLPPIMNKCCEDGRVYDPDSDGCVTLNEGMTTVKSESDPTESDTETPTTTETHKFGLNDHLTIPQRLVLDLTGGTRNDNGTEFLFGLSVNLPKSTCSKGQFIHRVNLTDFLQRSQGSGSGPRTPSKRKAQTGPSIVFTTKAQLLVGMEYYSAPEFCVIGIKEEILSLRVCNATCGGVTPCITRCCHLDRVWNKNRLIPNTRKSCVQAGRVKWTPVFYQHPKKRATLQETNDIHPHYKILGSPRMVKCPNGSSLLGTEQRDDLGRYFSKFRLTVDGQLHRRRGRYTWIPLKGSNNYCWDGLLNSPYLEGNGTETEYSGKDEVLFECSAPNTVKSAKSQSILYGAVMIIACIFLLLTIVVLIVLWDKQQNHVWNLSVISYCASLFCYYVVVATIHFVQSSLRRGKDTDMYSFCYFIGVAVHFFTISTFCWLSVISYDIFRTFKSIKPPSSKRQKGLGRYFVYSSFAWSLPTTVVTVALILDKLYRADVESNIIVPEYGVKRCDLDADYAQFVYNYGFVGVLLFFNFACFFVTVHSICKVRKSTKFVTTSSTKDRKQTQSLKLFAKLLIIMGLPYMSEFISWYTEKDKVNGNAWYWTITDVFNILQAIAIFYIFVCKPDVLHHLEQKCPSLRTVTKILLRSFDEKQAEFRVPSHLACVEQIHIPRLQSDGSVVYS